MKSIKNKFFFKFQSVWPVILVMIAKPSPLLVSLTFVAEPYPPKAMRPSRPTRRTRSKTTTKKLFFNGFRVFQNHLRIHWMCTR